MPWELAKKTTGYIGDTLWNAVNRNNFPACRGIMCNIFRGLKKKRQYISLDKDELYNIMIDNESIAKTKLKKERDVNGYSKYTHNDPILPNRITDFLGLLKGPLKISRNLFKMRMCTCNRITIYHCLNNSGYES